jgi:methylenetetrahydrofolate dehydrogenase (NADP+)/methenyltetrahydrofolate cyclohydrolase
MDIMIIDGKIPAEKLLSSLEEEIRKLNERKPGLSFILVGEHAPSQAYVRMKKRACEQVGIVSSVLTLPEEITQEALNAVLVELNRTPAVDGILVQMPLPLHLSVEETVSMIDPNKDVDGFHPLNMGKLLLGEEGGFTPCTPQGIISLLKYYNLTTQGKHIVIVGRSNIVGKPLAALLLKRGPYGDATVTIAHSKTEHIKKITKEADLLIAAIGKSGFITADMVKIGAVVIDVGINRTAEKTLVGDVDFKEVQSIASAITPVPGGVGPMTIASLLSNTWISYQRAKYV